MKQSGFSLVEAIVVLGILVIIGSIITGILYTTLRSANKSKIINAASLSGNYALSVITDIVNSSSQITAMGGTPLDATYNCTNAGGISAQSITLQRTDGGVTTLSCSGNTIASNSASLIDTSLVQADTSNPSACYYKCSQSSLYSDPIIEVGFSLTQIAANASEENRVSIDFKTDIDMKNYSQQYR